MQPLIIIGVKDGKLSVAALPGMDRAAVLGHIQMANSSVLSTNTPNGCDVTLAPQEQGIEVPPAAVQDKLLNGRGKLLPAPTG